MLNKEGHKSSPKHESYIAKIFNYNAQQKLGILKDKQLCNQVSMTQLFYDCQISLVSQV